MQRRNTIPNLYDDLFLKGDLFLPVSIDLKKRLIALGCDPSKIEVLHSGIDCSKLSYRFHTKRDDDAIKIISIGRLVEKKGISYGIEAIASLTKTYQNIRYDIIGDGPLRKKLESEIKQFSISDKIILHGWQDHDTVIEYLATAHILMAPSVTAENGDAEGIPNVIKEAMAMGLPVVSTLHGGISELVEDGVSGFLVQERDAESLADRIAYLIDHMELWEAMGASGRKKIEQDFNAARINDRLVELYQCNFITGSLKDGPR